MIYDVIGVGFGPSNIALAIAMEEAGYGGQALFLDRNSASLWHEGMLLDGADIQNSPLRDLITPVNPRSKYTFVNYLHESGRFFRYLNLGLHYPLRKEFFHYVRWAARQFDNVAYGVEVVGIEIDRSRGGPLWVLSTAGGTQFVARRLVLGTGRNPNVPDIPGVDTSDAVVHLTRYRQAVEGLARSRRIAVLGASQSAVEILLDLMHRGFERIYSIHRAFSYRLKDTSPWSDEVYFPEFIDYYHALPAPERARLDQQVRQTNYSSADRDVVDALYLRRYEEGLDGRERLRILRNHEIVRIAAASALTLHVRDVYTGAADWVDVDLLVLATGFLDVGRDGRAGLPRLLESVADLFSWSGDYLNVERDYRVRYEDRHEPWPDLYLNGLCESSHGLGDAGSFSLVSLRARDILASLGRSRDESGVHDIRHPQAAVRAS